MRDLYRNFDAEKQLYMKAVKAANLYCNGEIPAAVQERTNLEICGLFYSSCGTMFAAAAELADFGIANGCPVGFRGTLGNLLLTHLVGISAVDPMELTPRWESAMDHPDGGMQGITLNVPDTMLPEFAEHLESLLPACRLIRIQSGSTAAIRFAVTPGLPGDDKRLDDFFTFTLCPSRLMAMNGGLQIRDVPTPEEVADTDFLGRISFPDLAALLELDGLDGLLSIMKPVTFHELVRVIGVHLAPELSFQQKGQLLLDQVIGTREDLYEFLLAEGIAADDAFAIMQQAARGGFGRLTRTSKAILAKHGLLRSPVLRNLGYLYPRVQIADYLYRALALLWCSGKP